MRVWAIILDNYEDDTDTILFADEQSARETFENICRNHEEDEEFERDEDVCSWFDCRFNEFSTSITITSLELHNQSFTDL